MEPPLGELRQAAPWAPVSYNEMLKDTWNNDRADFLAYLDRQRNSPTPAR
jgi:hypothetical protein